MLSKAKESQSSQSKGTTVYKLIFAENRYQGQVMKSALKKVKPIPNPTRESVPATTLERAELEDAFDRETKVRSN